MRGMGLRRIGICVVVAGVWATGFAQKPKKDKAGYDRAARATVLHDAIVYVKADADGQKISLVTPGHEVVVVERSAPWVKVFANTDVNDDSDEDSKPEFTEDENVTPASGWIRDKGVVSPSTPGGDVILYGAAANFEEMATQPRAPKGAANAAHLLYRRVAEVLAGVAAGGGGGVAFRGCALAIRSRRLEDAALGEGAGCLPAAADLRR